MKKLLFGAALTFAAATFANAGEHFMIAQKVDSQLAAMSVNTDVYALTEDQINRLHQALQNDGTEARMAAVKVVLDDAGVPMVIEDDPQVAVTMRRSQLLRAVDKERDALDLQGMPLRALSNEQLTKLFFIANSGEPVSNMRILAMEALVN